MGNHEDVDLTRDLDLDHQNVIAVETEAVGIPTSIGIGITDEIVDDPVPNQIIHPAPVQTENRRSEPFR